MILSPIGPFEDYEAGEVRILLIGSTNAGFYAAILLPDVNVQSMAFRLWGAKYTIHSPIKEREVYRV